MAKAKPAAALHVKRSAKLEIDGRTYQLAYDFNAIAEAEASTGCNLLHGISAALFGTLSAAQLRGLLCASLRAGQPDITLAETGALIRIDTLERIHTAIAEAWGLSLPEKKENPPEAGAAPAGNAG